MKYVIKIDGKQKEPLLTIATNSITTEVEELIKILDTKQEFLLGYQNKKIKMLEFKEIINIYSLNKKIYKIYAKTINKEYEIKQRLYDLEELLKKHYFVRISNSEIINLKQVIEFDASFSDTISVKLKDNNITYVSRKYIKQIKQVLKIGGKNV
ncbi:MAG: LytTR family DNA-binding domain-containing protein [Bacilli bacterium]